MYFALGGIGSSASPATLAGVPIMPNYAVTAANGGTKTMQELAKDALTVAVAELLGGDVTELPLERLQHLVTVTQHATDVLLNETERRGEFTSAGDVPIIPYMPNYSAETIITHPGE